MSDLFDVAVPSFDRLTAAERQRLRDAIDIGVFPAGTVVLGRDEPGDSLFIVIKGTVQERHGGEVLGTCGPGDSFDLRTLFGGGQSHVFEAAEDTICQLLPRQTLVELARGNPAFAEFVYRDFADRMRALASERAEREMAAMTMARIREAFIHPPVMVDATATVRAAAQAMKDQQATSVLVRERAGEGAEQVGIVTGTDLRDAVIIDGMPVESPVGPLARRPLVALERDDLLFNALILMTKHSVRRVVITEAGAIVGVLEQNDLLGALSNHSQAIALQIDRAVQPDDLRRASHDMLGLIRTLHATGVKVPFIAELVTELNRKIFRKLFELLAPPALLANSCLIVMGSEGRGEQILKTDQDNGLILRDGFTGPDLERVTADFTRHLVEFGYPPCPGNIMVSNPEWTKSISAYKDAIKRWIFRPDEQAPLNLAIFFDAAAVAGDSGLLDEARAYLIGRMQDNQSFFAHFARPVLSFDTPTGLFAGLFERRSGQPVDIKKAAIFPIVHGVRALALEKRLEMTNTVERIWALAEAGTLDRAFAGELTEAFAFLSTQRLKARIGSVGPGGTQTDNSVRLEEMGKLERDQFKDCLALVKRFKDLISHHFHLNML